MRLLLTGLPASGKTTLANHLAVRTGMPVRQEAARYLLALGYDVGPDMTLDTLATVLLMQVALDIQAPEEMIADRGPIDFLAYGQLIAEASGKSAVQVVFNAMRLLCESWLQIMRYDLVVYHDDVCGARGDALRRGNQQYLNNLRRTFDAVLYDQRVPFIKIPPHLTTEQRAELVMAKM